MFKRRKGPIRGHTLGCRAYHSSIWVSSSQESKAISTSPRNRFCPKRSWCHTEACRLRVSSCEWLITYYKRQEKPLQTFSRQKSLKLIKLTMNAKSQGSTTDSNGLQRITAHALTLRFSLKTGLMELALILVFLLLCRDVSGSRYVFT